MSSVKIPENSASDNGGGSQLKFEFTLWEAYLSKYVTRGGVAKPPYILFWFSGDHTRHPWKGTKY